MSKGQLCAESLKAQPLRRTIDGEYGHTSPVDRAQLGHPLERDIAPSVELADGEQARRTALHGVMLHYDTESHGRTQFLSEVTTVVIGIVELEFDLVAPFSSAQVEAQADGEHIPVVANRGCRLI